MYSGDRSVAYALLSSASLKKTKVTIKARTNTNEEVKYEAMLNPEKAIKDSFVHKLAVRRIIQDMENVKDIVAMATKYNLASAHTSFVLVEGKITMSNLLQWIDREEAVSGTMKQVHIDRDQCIDRESLLINQAIALQDSSLDSILRCLRDTHMVIIYIYTFF